MKGSQITWSTVNPATMWLVNQQRAPLVCRPDPIPPSQHTYSHGNRATDGQVVIHTPAPVDSSTSWDVTHYNTTFTELTVTTTATSLWPAVHPQAL